MMSFLEIENKIKSLTLESGNCESIPISNSNCYYSLANVDSSDKETLERLQKERLKCVLGQLQREREDTSFSRTCLFCKKHFVGNRSVLLSHLMEKHNFVFGAPDNVVFINEFLDHLEELLKNLQCFYCEKIFKDWMTLKEHMRKKQHKRINPQNQTYDKFYVINYLEPGKTWVQVQEEEDGCSQDDSEKEKEMMDWEEDNLIYVCLFCENKFADFDLILRHMKDDHKFDFKLLKESNNLNFYSQIKLINYIRKKVFEKECIFCESKFPFHEEMMQHMMHSGHISMFPDSSKWDQPSYYFSTFENDHLLCALDAEDSDLRDCQVYPEDPVIPHAAVYPQGPFIPNSAVYPPYPVIQNSAVYPPYPVIQNSAVYPPYPVIPNPVIYIEDIIPPNSSVYTEDLVIPNPAGSPGEMKITMCSESFSFK